MSFLDFFDSIPDRIMPGLYKRKYLEHREPPVWYTAWREVCHAAGSVILIVIGYFLSLYVYTYSSIIIFALLTAWMTYQEFYLHPKKYGQTFWHGVCDWLAWIVPFVIYFIFF